MGRRGLSLALCLCLAGAGCGDEKQDVQVGELPDVDRSMCSEEGIVRPGVRTRAFSTSSVNNYAHVDGDVAWVVHSGDHTVGRLDLNTDRFDPSFVNLSPDGGARNPWDLAFSPERLFVSNYLSNSFQVVNKSTGALIEEISEPDLVAPGSPAWGNGVLVVPSSGVAFPEYKPGKLFVYSARDGEEISLLGVLALAEKNSAQVVFHEERNRFYALSTGELGSSPEGSFVPLSEGALEVLDGEKLLEGDLEGARVGKLVVPLVEEDPRAGAPRRVVVTPDGRFAYLPSATSPQIYKADLESLAWVRGTDNPVLGYTGEGNQLTGLAFDDRGVGFVVSYNQDAVYLLDPSCDAVVEGPVDVGTTPLLEGANHIMYDEARGRMLVLMTISSSMTVLSL